MLLGKNRPQERSKENIVVWAYIGKMECVVSYTK